MFCAGSASLYRPSCLRVQKFEQAGVSEEGLGIFRACVDVPGPTNITISPVSNTEFEFKRF